MDKHESISLNEQIEKQIDIAVDEAIVEELANKNGFLKKTQTIVMMTAALIISAGQWNDSVDAFNRVYSSSLAHFTHKIEYKEISKIHVGNTLSYVQQFVGMPQIIKISKLNPLIQFRYFIKDKYDLTLISQGERIIGYSILSKLDEFNPKLPFVSFLGKETLKQQNHDIAEYYCDSNNLVYFVDVMPANKQQMFLKVMQGYIEYGVQVSNRQNEKVSSLPKQIEHIVELETFSDSQETLTKALQKVRSNLYPNFYSVTEADPQIVTESLLTRFEYRMYTNS